MTKRSRRLWRCAACGRTFANRNQTHTCGLHTLEEHFERSTPGVIELFNRFIGEVRRSGPFEILPENTRIALHLRMSFAALVLQKRALAGHLVLAERHELPCFRRIETLSSRNHVHHFRIADHSAFTATFRRMIRASYRVGEQKHLGAPR